MKCGYLQGAFCTPPPPPASALFNVAILERELFHHPNRDFSNSSINALRFGTHVEYTGTEKIESSVT